MGPGAGLPCRGGGKCGGHRRQGPGREELPGTKLFVGSLPYEAKKADLLDLFAEFGDICDCHLVTERSTGQSKGFAFVTLKEKDKGDEIIKALNGTEVLGRKIRVDVSQKKSGGRANSNPKKSSRELRALREEAEDSKKPRRKPKNKKD